MKHFLLRSLNQTTWCYAYIGLLYALYFVYFVVVPAYRERHQLSDFNYVCFNIVFLYFFGQGYLNLIRTTFTPTEKASTVDRSHHCRLCARSIPVHDHHCFFVGVCIGQHNQRYFLLMLFHLLCAHFVGYAFVCDYLWREVGGYHLITVPKILFFNIGYVVGFVETKWQAFIAFHHYLVYFDVVFIGKLFYQVLRRALNGQTEYEEKKGIVRPRHTLAQIFGSNPWSLIFPILCPE